MATLIIIDQPPYGTWEGREALDMAFSMAAFDQPVSLLFCGAGVNWLRKDQQAGSIDQKSVERNLSAAPIFGVDALVADRAACERYGLNAECLLSIVTMADTGPDFLEQFEHTLFAG